MVIKVTLWDKYKTHRKLYWFEVTNTTIDVLRVQENIRTSKSTKFCHGYFWDKISRTLNKPPIVDPEAYTKLAEQLHKINEKKR